jgi:hypothetical protein
MDAELSKSSHSPNITEIADRLCTYYDDLLCAEIVAEYTINDPYAFIETRVCSYFRDRGFVMQTPALSHFRYLKHLHTNKLLYPNKWHTIDHHYTQYKAWCQFSLINPCCRESFEMRLRREGYQVEDDKIKLSKFFDD